MSPREGFFARGWHHFPADPDLLDWSKTVKDQASELMADAELRSRWLRHGETWFAGVNVLGNDAEGRLAGGPPLATPALDLARALYGDLPLDPGQLSVVYPGYPRRDPTESDAAHRFRRDRDAAHVDGLKPFGSDRRRRIGETHAFILGLPLTASQGSPLVVWDGSHEIMRAAFAEALTPHDPATWESVDLTDVYQATRRRCFETCERIELRAAPGEATLLHRLTLHGVAPWAGPETAPRAIAYFRPALPGGPEAWLTVR